MEKMGRAVKSSAIIKFALKKIRENDATFSPLHYLMKKNNILLTWRVGN